MRLATAKEHRDFFQKNGWIEFEGIISSTQCESIFNNALDIINKRIFATQKKPSIHSEELYLKGYHLWQESPEIKKMTAFPKLLEIAAELLGKEIFRMGFDQFFPKWPEQESSFAIKTTSQYTDFLKETASLESVSCIRGISCGAMIALCNGNASEKNEPIDAVGFDPFPYKKGNLIFFNAQAPIRWSSLEAHEGQSFYLIAFADKAASYGLNPKDPHTHDLKRMGYVFNDKLDDKLHPIVYRR